MPGRECNLSTTGYVISVRTLRSSFINIPRHGSISAKSATATRTIFIIRRWPPKPTAGSAWTFPNSFPITATIFGASRLRIRKTDMSPGAGRRRWALLTERWCPARPVGHFPSYRKLPCVCSAPLKIATATKAWTQYGFVDAFNPLTGWYDADVVGIDVGITLVMAENARTSFVWNTFMKNVEAQRGMTRAGFKPDATPAPPIPPRNKP